MRYQLRGSSWWAQGVKKYYLQKVWYYDGWVTDEGKSVISGTVSVWWGTWDECIDKLKELGW